MLRLEDVALTAGAKTLLEGAELHVRPGDRVGLIGRNGTGKTTTLRLLAGEVPPDAGTVHRRGGVVVGYLPQHAVSGSTLSVWEEARTGMVRFHALSRAVATAQAAVEAGEPGAIDKLDAAQERFRLEGGFAADERVGEVLHGLGFGPEDWVRTCDTFSGGWQMRIALARLLLSDPDLMLLDEPTNHLDMASRSWLARHLSTLDATLVIVSHDRHLLDAVSTRTVEIRSRRLDAFSGPLTAWLAERALRDAQAVATRSRQDAEIARLEGFIDRFGAKATKASQAQARRKALDRIERVELPEHEGTPRLVLPPSPPSSEEVVQLQGAAFGWTDTPVLAEVDHLVLRGQRWAVLGPNGSGKSTLLHALAGRLPMLAGRRRLGRDVQLSVFDQDLVRALPGEVTALDHVLMAAPAVSPQRARAALGALGLHGDAALRTIGSLSGGEKARVVLAALAVRPSNLLLLDEPTNHLDAVTVDVVAHALAAWEGSMVLVTHDRWLVERLATHVAIVRNGRVDTYDRVLPEHLEPITEARVVSAERAEGAATHADRKERKRQERRLEKLHAEADAVAASIDAIDAALYTCGDDHARATALAAERVDAEARLEALFEELGELEATLHAS